MVEYSLLEESGTRPPASVRAYASLDETYIICRKREQQLRRDAQAQLQELQRKRGRDRGRKVLKLSSEHLEAEPENEPEEEAADGASTEPLDLRSLELKLTVDLEALAEATGRNLGRNDINLLKVFLSTFFRLVSKSLAVAMSSQKANHFYK
jgi:hypothetical protein